MYKPLNYRVTTSVVVLVAAIAVGFWLLTSVARKANEAAKISRAVAVQAQMQISENKSRIENQARTIRFLCDTVAVIDDLVTASISAVQIQLVDDLVNRPRTAAADRAFIARFQSDHAQLLDGLTREKSPCNIG